MKTCRWEDGVVAYITTDMSEHSFTFMHLSNVFIQSDSLHIQAVHAFAEANSYDLAFASAQIQESKRMSVLNTPAL